MGKGQAGGREGRGRPRRLGMLMLGAFLAGLLVVGVAFLLPGGGEAPSPPLAQQSPAQAPQARPAQAIPQAPSRPLPRLAIVVDDLGYEPSRDAEWLKLPAKLTVAVIPFGPSSRKVAETARARGWGVILHVPMEPETAASDRTERFRIRRGMTAEEMDSLLARMIEEIPQATGASNHMGSAVTSDPEAMAIYASVLGKKRLFLLDSVTTPKSVAPEAARRAGIPSARRDVFLDADMSPADMLRQWERALSIARENGAAVLVCHGRSETLRMMAELIPRLKNENVQAVTLDELLSGTGTQG